MCFQGVRNNTLIKDANDRSEKCNQQVVLKEPHLVSISSGDPAWRRDVSGEFEL